MAIQDSGSNYQFFKKTIFEKVPRSLFDLSYLNTFTAQIGALIPFWTQHTVPNEDYEINVEALVRCINPPVVPLMSRLRVFFHVYWIDYESLWKGWQFFMTKGRSGNYVNKIPQMVINNLEGNISVLTFGSLADYLGLPVAQWQNLLSAPDSTRYATGFSALPFMMYQRIYRDYYMNQNLYTDVKYQGSWFPVYDGDFRLPVDSYLSSAFSVYDNPVGFFPHDAGSITSDYDVTTIGLGLLRYRNYTEDYFTSALPWPQRGNAPQINFSGSVDVSQIPVGITDDGKFVPLSIVLSKGNTQTDKYSSIVDTSINTLQNTFSTSMSQAQVGGIVTPGGVSMVSTSSGINTYDFTASGSGTISLAAGLTLGALRELNSIQRIMEKMARTQGSYGDFCTTFFGEKPKSAHDHRPIYVGGCYQPIKISEVLQVGGTQSSGDVATTVQGTQTGYAFSYGDGYIGKFHCDDYGMFMGIMSIMPDSMYFQGVHRDNSRSLQEDFYIPERAGLSPRAILNQEIYFDPKDVEQNNDMFAYQDIWDEMRFRSNEIHGEIANPDNLSFFPLTQARYFKDLPTYSQSFMTTEGTNMRTDWLSAPNEIPFAVQVANKIRAVRPLPYHAQPAELFKTT